MEFEQYVVARRTALVRSAVLLGAAQHEAEDLVQAALTRCLRSWRRVAQAHNPDAYVYRVLTNVMRDAASRRWNGEVPTEAVPDGPVHDPDAVAGLHVRRVLAALPLEQRQVLVLRYYADLSEREIASALGVSAGTVKSRASRGLARLAADHDLRSSDV